MVVNVVTNGGAPNLNTDKNKKARLHSQAKNRAIRLMIYVYYFLSR